MGKHFGLFHSNLVTIIICSFSSSMLKRKEKRPEGEKLFPAWQTRILILQKHRRMLNFKDVSYNQACVYISTGSDLCFQNQEDISLPVFVLKFKNFQRIIHYFQINRFTSAI